MEENYETRFELIWRKSLQMLEMLVVFMSGLSTSCLAALIANVETHFVLFSCKICLQIELFFTLVLHLLFLWEWSSQPNRFPSGSVTFRASLWYSGSNLGPSKNNKMANLYNRSWNFGKHEAGQDIALVSFDSVVSTAEKPSGRSLCLTPSKGKHSLAVIFSAQVA